MGPSTSPDIFESAAPGAVLSEADIEAVIADCRRSGKRAETKYGTIEYYSYPHALGTAWGINGGKHGHNVKRGIMPR